MVAAAVRSISDAKSLSGAQRAAVLVMYLGEDVARKLLGHLPTPALGSISEAMVDVQSITPEVIEGVVKGFLEDLYRVALVPNSGSTFVLDVLPGLIDEERRHKIIGPIRRRLSKGFEEYVATRPAAVVAAILHDEHPQTQALACLLMGADNASAILQQFEEADRYDIALRMARTRRIPGELADEVEHALREALDDRGTDLWKIEGIDRAAQALGRMEITDQELLLGQIADEDYDLSEMLRRRMVVFSDLRVMDDRGVQQLLKNVERNVILLALRGADPIMREVFFSNMAKRAAQDLREELEYAAPVPKSQVEDAQEEIVNTALRLRDEGVIALPLGGADDDMV